MSKFTAEDKLQAVLRYINGKESYREIGRSIGIDHKSIVKWVRRFEHHGAEAFTKNCITYTPEFKLEVLNYMIENGTSLCETAAVFNIPTLSNLAIWKKKFETQGIDAFQSKKKRVVYMKNKPNQPSKKPATEGSVKALEERIKQLEMENEYLKKLKALAQKKEQSLNKTKRK